MKPEDATSPTSLKVPGTTHEYIGWFLCVGMPVLITAYSYFHLSYLEVSSLDSFLITMASITITCVLTGFCTWLRGVYLYRNHYKTKIGTSK